MSSAAVEPPRSRTFNAGVRTPRPASVPPIPCLRRALAPAWPSIGIPSKPRPRTPRLHRALTPALATTTACLLAALAAPRPLAAQLRPLDPLEWQAFDAAEPVRLGLGVAAFQGQRASLAGVRGRLWELGLVRVSWRTGRVLFEASGTALRAFRDEVRLEAPAAGVSAGAGGLRWDAGDWELATALRLTPADAPVALALRFGTRLPTTDNRVGLERDATDFFAVVAGRWRTGRLTLSAESGLGIHGTRDPDFEQSDVWFYVLAVEYRRGWLAPRLELVGQEDGLNHRAPRGTEELRELRLGLRAGRKRWVELSLVRGLEEFSPAAGLAVGVGMLLPARHGEDPLAESLPPGPPPPPPW